MEQDQNNIVLSIQMIAEQMLSTILGLNES